MLKRFLLLLALFVGVSLSKRIVSFKVIAFGEKVEVQIASKKYPLAVKIAGEPLYSSKVSSCPDGDFEYKYVVDGVEEPFNRKLSANTAKTYNEFYGREETVKELGQFKYPDNHWNRSIGKTTLFDDSYIPTIHFSGKKAEKFFHNPAQATKIERITIYLKDSKKSFLNAPVSAKNKNFEKFQIKLSLSKNANINGRYLLKFRNGSEDPINLRQTIYGNINQAIGIPSIHSVMVRVYYNGKPAGFYTMQEEAASESFIRAEFYGNPETQLIDAPASIGDTFDCSCGADFEYHPANMSFYFPFEQKFGNDKSKVIALTKAIEELNPFNEAEVEEFDKKWLDIDTFHKAMCMEYLTADWDGYWYFTSNFALYQDPKQSTDSTYKFYFITQDHDETFGIGLTDTINTVGYDFPKVSYTTMLNKTWHGDEYDAFRRTLVDKFIASTPKLQKRFQDTLISIVQNIFNPVAFKKVVSTYFDRYRPEVEWDYSFTRPYTRKVQVPDWRYNDFLEAFDSPRAGVPWGLYEWVTLRAEALKKEFCITWEGDSNPPDSSCVPYKIPGSEDNTKEETTSTTAIEVETTSTIIVETTTIVNNSTVIESTTTAVEPTSTAIESTSTAVESTAKPNSTVIESTSTVVEPTSTAVESTTAKPNSTVIESTSTAVESTTAKPNSTVIESTSTDVESTTAKPNSTVIESTSTAVEPTSTVVESTTQIEQTTTTITSTTTTTTTAAKPTSATKSTKTIPSSRGSFANWFKNKKPSDFVKTPKVKRATQQLPKKSYI